METGGEGKRRLTARQQAWLEEYLQLWNASEAARRAGYKGNVDVTASRLLGKASIQVAIKARLAEKAMAADEVLARLAEQARGSMADFLELEDGKGARISLSKAKEAGKLHLLKKYDVDDKGVKIELYDAQAALVHIGRHHGLFEDKLNVRVEDLDAAIERELAKLVTKQQSSLVAAPAGDERGSAGGAGLL